MPKASNASEFVIDPSANGSFDLFRRSRLGFILVDTFDTEMSAARYIESVRTMTVAHRLAA